MEEVRLRIEQAADSILGDERLTAGLDDDTADILLDWGLALATAVAAETKGLDDENAIEIIQPRVKATKRLLRYVKDWMQNCSVWDLAEKEDKLSKIYYFARLASGNDLVDERMTNGEESVDPELAVFLSQTVGLEGNSRESVIELRQLIEGNGQEMANG